MSDRLSIGEFARRSGLSVSAVRFYGDRGLLRPACVDPVTGYRSYDEAQIEDAVLVRDLRRLGMGLRDVAAYAAASASARRALVDRHLDDLERRLHEARSVAHTLHARTTRQETPMTAMTVTADGLLDALDQVLPAAGSDPEQPVLTCVLVEARNGSLRLVATDRHRLAIRDLVPTGGSDATFRSLVPAATLRRWRSELPSGGDLTVEVLDDHLVVRHDGVEARHPSVPASFPAYEAVLARDGAGYGIGVGGRGAAAGQVVVDRRAALAAFERLAEQGDAVLLRARPGELALIRRDERESVSARYDGPELHVALDPAFARDAVAAALGPEVVIEVAEPLRPVVFRSADDGTYTTLLMPVRLS